VPERPADRASAGTVAVVVTDAEIAAFLQGVELAAVAVYEEAAAALGSPAAVAAAKTFVTHHLAHARAFGDLAGGLAVAAAPESALEAVEPAAGLASEHDGLTLLAALEARLAATQHAMLGHLSSTPAIALVATILPVECQHGVVLGTLLSEPLAELVPTTQGDDGRLLPQSLAGP
jgi:Ferritin-like domain